MNNQYKWSKNYKQKNKFILRKNLYIHFNDLYWVGILLLFVNL